LWQIIFTFITETELATN